MRITVNDTELYFDVEGPGLVADGPTMRDRPTLLALHGGPGFDHAYFKPALSQLADTVQVVYLDLRGQGLSVRPPTEIFTLEQMADDVAAFCATLGIDRPIVLGHSAGGFVALNLAVRHPHIAGRLILMDTAAATADMGDAMATLEQRHGRDARAAAERMFGGDFSDAAMTDFMRLVFPAYVYDPSKFGTDGEAVGRSA
jgi:proline iminopeptidase